MEFQCNFYVDFLLNTVRGGNNLIMSHSMTAITTTATTTADIYIIDGLI